ncbi:MAG TPA: hypothetical protein VFS05_05890 [Gemmatimonadaceae bacterium]|nr:hypothetical protein [Gemmatimonadaceae bacterium]
MNDLRRLVTFALGVVGIALLGACQEKLEGGAACPSLCPEQELEVRDTVLMAAVSLDTTLLDYPRPGTEPLMLVAARGDTLRSAAVLRFDTLFNRISRGTDTSQQHVVAVDTASVVLTIADTLLKSGPVTFAVYDVDTTVAAEPDTAAVRTLFRPDRLLATQTVPDSALAGQLRIAVPKQFVEQRVLSGGRVRLGITVTGPSTELRVVSSEGGATAALSYLARAAVDTQTLQVSAFTRAPEGTTGLTAFRDYQLVLVQPPAPAGVLAVGGIPGRRVYLRFDLPPALVETTTVVRATLVLTQVPNTAWAARDTVKVLPRIVTASSILDPEPGKAALLLASPAVGPPVSPIPAAQGGTRRIEMASVVRRWRAAGTQDLTHALVLQDQSDLNEGSQPRSVFFYSIDAADPDVRPRLEISFIPRAGFGLP